MTEHATFEDLSAYTDDELSAPRRAQIEAHIVGCADCRAAARELRWVSSFTRALPQAEMPAGMPVRVPRQATALSAPTRLRGAWVAAGAIAAAITLGLAGLWAAGARAPAHSTAGEEALGRSWDGAPLAALDTAAEAEAIAEAALGTADVDAVAAREPESPAFGRAPTADSASAGYPEPLSTARQDDLDLYGGVPPPELGGDVVLPTVASAQRVRPPAAAAAVTETGGRADGTPAPAVVMGDGPGSAPRDPAVASAPGQRSAVSGAPVTVSADADAHVGELRATEATAAALPRRVAAPAAPLALLVLVAALLLALSAALFARAWSR